MEDIRFDDRVIKIVSPKKAKLAEAETELARQMDKLNEKTPYDQSFWDRETKTLSTEGRGRDREKRGGILGGYFAFGR